MTCHVCGNASFRAGVVSKGFNVDGRPFRVKNIPAGVCDRSGEADFTAEVAERWRTLVREPTWATRIVQAELVR